MAIMIKPRYVISTGCALTVILLLRLRARYPLRNKVVVITGRSRGLGLAMAREFVRDGAQLALLARDGEELQRAAAGMRKSLDADVSEHLVARFLAAIGFAFNVDRVKEPARRQLGRACLQ